ncbi:MAG TPA: M13 family metallopeptidase [Azospirillaceae bacterium]|nr:M13 family metallopeptidase [Azospirillaceae bacterium]
MRVRSLPSVLMSGVCLGVLAAGLAAVPVSTAAAQAAQSADPAKVSVGIDLAGIDRTVKPGDDFDAYANGGWRKATEIPADRASTGVGFMVYQRAEKRLADLIRELGESNPPAGSDARKIADYYASFMDEAGIEAKGLAPLKPELDAAAALSSKADLAAYLGARLRADVDPLNATNFFTENLFGLFVAQAPNDPSRNVPYLLQGGLGMPDREYYVADAPEMAEFRTKYQAYIAEMLTLAGTKDAEAKAKRIFELEMKIARAHATLVETQDVHKGNNPWKREDFAAKAPGLDWAAYFKAAGLDGQDTFIAWQPGAITAIAALVGSEPLETWKEYLAFRAVNKAAPFLPKAFADARFGFYGRTLNGTPKQRDRWKRAITNTDAALGDAVGKLYVERHFSPEAKAQAQEMVRNIVAAFDRRIDRLEWMAPATKAKAKQKLASLRVGVGYPETWRDYSSLEVVRGDALGNFMRAQAFEYRHQRAKLGKPVDRDEWWMTPQTVNAVNLPLQIALNFPAAILEPPFFDPAADAAANYGAIGSVIGHEIVHAFDNLGAEFDPEGRLANWWTAEDLAHFKAAGERLVKQYDAYEALPGLTINGQQTLGENIADVAGLAAAHDGYVMSLGGKPAPVVEGLTGDQRFFLAFAQAWREKKRDPALRQQVVTDVHAPGRWRAQTVRNLDAWYPAFGARQGEALYLDPAERVRIW